MARRSVHGLWLGTLYGKGRSSRYQGREVHLRSCLTAYAAYTQRASRNQDDVTGEAIMQRAHDKYICPFCGKPKIAVLQRATEGNTRFIHRRATCLDLACEGMTLRLATKVKQ